LQIPNGWDFSEKKMHRHGLLSYAAGSSNNMMAHRKTASHAMKRTPCPLLTPMLLLWLATGNLGCGSEETHASEQIKGGMVCAVLAHPDDETMISGTLSMLADKGFDIAVIYATSGG
jgi:hypothetical protein